MSAKTAKSVGIQKGDWFRVASSGWYGKVISNAHTQIPTCYVLGIYDETGGIHFSDMVRIPTVLQEELEHQHKSAVKVFKAPLKVRLDNDQDL